MKYLIIIFFSSTLFAQINPVICEEDVVEQLANGLSLPNCLNRKLSRNPETKDESICKTCKEKFESLYPDPLVKLEKENVKKKFLDVALKEYRKSIINNVIDAIKIRSLPETGSKFAKSIKSCSLKTASSFKENCKNPNNLKLLEEHPLFKDLKTEIANEVASFINTDQNFSQKPTLLERKSNSCFISEQQLVVITSRVTEEELTPGVIEFLRGIDSKSFSSTTELFESQGFKNVYAGDKMELLSSLKNHPILSKHFEDPDSIVNFFTKVKAPFSKNNLKSLIYSPTEGDNLDEKLAKNCNDTFSSFKMMICGDEFKDANLALDPVSNHRKLFSEDFTANPEEFAKSQELVNKNLTLFQYCGNYNDNSLRLNDESKKISQGLEDKHKDYSLTDFVQEKYLTEIGSPNEIACGKECKPGSINCKIKEKFNKSKDPSSEEYKLANSSNTSGNSLLRSMIGDKQNLNTKTVEVLVAAGILPREDGTLVPQPDIPERRQDYFTNEVKRETIAAGGRPADIKTPVRTAATRRTDTQDAPFVQNTNSESTSESVQEIAPTESLSDIEDEIRRRLSEIPRGVPQNRNQARSIVRQATRERGRTITPQQENRIIDQMMDRQYSPVLPGIGRSIASTTTPSVSDTPTLAEKWRNGQRDEALAGMAGANQATTSEIIDQASKDAPKPLTTVALNIAEDPRITLSDIFNDKITRNDAETQLLKVLLRNRKDFVLQLNNMNFKVIFDQKNGFNVLLEPGTNEAALRYKPQLEIFLKRLRV